MTNPLIYWSVYPYFNSLLLAIKPFAEVDILAWSSRVAIKTHT